MTTKTHEKGKGARLTGRLKATLAAFTLTLATGATAATLPPPPANDLNLASVPLLASGKWVPPNVFVMLDDSGSMWSPWVEGIALDRSDPNVQAVLNNIATGNYTVDPSQPLPGPFTHVYIPDSYGNTGTMYYGYLTSFYAYPTWMQDTLLLLAFLSPPLSVPNVFNLRNTLAYDSAKTYTPPPGKPNAPWPGGSYTFKIWNDVDGDGQFDTDLDLTTPGDEISEITVTSTSPDAQNFANWWAYYRRRIDVAKSAIASVVTEYGPKVRFGYGSINGNNPPEYKIIAKRFPPATATDFSSHNEDLIDSLYNTYADNGTPLRRALDLVGKYYDGQLGDDPIIDACQKNYTLLFTDGYWNGPTPWNVGNVDGDLHTNWLSDYALYYYNKDLSPLPNILKPDSWDPATHQHMVTFGIAFGITGNLQDTDGDGWPDPNPGISGDWGNDKVDDLWHAAYNGHGLFLSANDKDGLLNGLRAFLENISARNASLAAVASDSTHVSANANLFQSRFTSFGWTGELLDLPINPDGSVSASPLWEAGCVLTGGLCPQTGVVYPGKDWDSRTILTWNGTKGVKFRWSKLKNWQKKALRTNPEDGSLQKKSKGKKRLKWLRGKDISHFRNRASLLGDIVHSSPVYVGAPAFGWPDTMESAPYSAFRAAYAGRDPVVYVGANDGMLHGFRASDGEEVLAYVPAAVFRNLSALTSKKYGKAVPHRYFVDGTPTVVDAFYNGAWHTVLTSGLRGGGQAIFALDVTDPAAFAESNAANLVLWEFDDGDDPDLGYSYSRPAIVKLNNGKWAAVFGNGYNNTEPDGHASTTGNAALFIVDLESGALIRKIDTQTGFADDPTGAKRPNGLATPAPVDADGDGVVDLVYAGDLFGNLWKFDLSSSSPASWDVAYHTASGDPQPLFAARGPTGAPQPITVRPEVVRHPEGGFMVLFGTGKYLEDSDPGAAIGVQTLYGIWDRNRAGDMTAAERAVFGRNHLLRQCIMKETSGFGREVRITTTYQPNWRKADGLGSATTTGSPSWCPAPDGSAEHLGWYLDLANLDMGSGALVNPDGERVVVDPLARGRRAVFNTLIPAVSGGGVDSCDAGLDTGWLMEVDAFSGARLPVSPLDLNGDSKFDSGDEVAAGDLDGDGSGDMAPVSGIKSQIGFMQTPAVLRNGNAVDAETKYVSGSSGKIDVLLENGADTHGRLSWEHL